MTELIKRIFTSIILLSIIAISFAEIRILYFLNVLIIFFVLDEIFKIIKKIFKKNKIQQLISFIFSISYMFLFSLIIILFLNQSFEINKVKVLFLLFICISTDIGGYVVGKIIGGKKLTKISPNKTYSGLVGSFIFSFLIGYLFYYSQEDLKSIDINIIFLIFMVSFISQIGDLFISFLKRRAKIKDTGSFLPGHGGILDRIDGILFALPLGIIFLLI